MLPMLLGCSSRTTGAGRGSASTAARSSGGRRAIATTPVRGTSGASSASAPRVDRLDPRRPAARRGRAPAPRASCSSASGSTATASTSSAPKRSACLRAWKPSRTAARGRAAPCGSAGPSAALSGSSAATSPPSADDLELAHQAVVLVVEHVAVDDELAGVVGEVAGDEDPFAGEDEEGLLEAVFPGRRRLAVAGEQVPVGVVHVHHVGDLGAVDDLPGLGRAELREGVGAGRVEGLAVDQPGRS